MSLVIDESCYAEFGTDLSGCSRQDSMGCKGCKWATKTEEGE